MGVRVMSTVDINQVRAGWGVYGSDGERVGDVSEVEPDYVAVAGGALPAGGVRIPAGAIAGVERGRVLLGVAAGQVGSMGLGGAPATGTRDDEVTVRLHEEELRAQTVAREAGEVRVTKGVVEEERTLDVPVTRERVQVRSVEPSQSAADPSEAFRGGTISVPVSEEEVRLTKEVRVAEELEIEKTAVREAERVTGTVRREVADVERAGDVDADAGAGGGATGATRG